MSSSLPIGFFDSGVGGLSVYAKFKQILPNESTLYFGDLIHLPYGNKSQKQLIGYAKDILDFYKNKNVKAVVIACNTSSAQAYDFIKDKYNFKIYPIIQSCAKIISDMNINKIGVFATEATVSSGVYTKELQRHNSKLKVKEIACPNWVSIVEGKLPLNANSTKEDIKQHLDKMLTFNPEKIILGCTHYPYLQSELEQYTTTNLFIDPAEIFVQYIKEDLEKNNLLNNGNNPSSEEFYVSSNPEQFKNNATIFYPLNKLPQVVIQK